MIAALTIALAAIFVISMIAFNVWTLLDLHPVTLKSKLIVGAVVLTIVATTGVITVNRIKADAFKDGQVSERQLHAEALQKAQEANDAQTAGLRATIIDYAARIDVLSHQRRDREQVVVTKIEERLVDQPNCEITPEIIALRNEIRAQ